MQKMLLKIKYAQIENMITKKVDILVIASIDGEALTEVLNKAKNQGIPVIAYDRLIMNSDHVSYYATFDNFKVGVLQGKYIEEQLGLENEQVLLILNYLQDRLTITMHISSGMVPCQYYNLTSMKVN